MAVLAIQDIDLSGIDPTMETAASGGDKAPNSNERVHLRIVNAAGGARTITIAAQNNCNHGFSHDIVLVTADTDDITVGPFDKERFNDASQELAITYDNEVGVTIAALNLTKAP